MFSRGAERPFSMAVSPQVGQLSRPRFFCEAKSLAEPNQPSKRWPLAQCRSNTIMTLGF
jgi:hypothetical protein